MADERHVDSGTVEEGFLIHPVRIVGEQRHLLIALTPALSRRERGQGGGRQNIEERLNVIGQRLSPLRREMQRRERFALLDGLLDRQQTRRLKPAGVGCQIAVGQAREVAKLDEGLARVIGQRREDAQAPGVGDDGVEGHRLVYRT